MKQVRVSGLVRLAKRLRQELAGPIMAGPAAPYGGKRSVTALVPPLQISRRAGVSARERKVVNVNELV
jgi:hypothetical protein